MPWPIKLFLVGLFASIFGIGLVLARRNLERNAFLSFLTMKWINRGENEWEFWRQTYAFPLGSGLAFVFALFQMLRS